jgi:hypothetical protein
MSSLIGEQRIPRHHFEKISLPEEKSGQDGERNSFQAKAELNKCLDDRSGTIQDLKYLI